MDARLPTVFEEIARAGVCGMVTAGCGERRPFASPNAAVDKLAGAPYPIFVTHVSYGSVAQAEVL